MGAGTKDRSEQKMSSCIIVSAGTIEADFHKDEYIDGSEYMICADGGYDNALKLGIKPNLLVGDMDSISAQVNDCEVILAAPEKDDTDTMLATKIAIERGYTAITIIGGLGGRLDHTIANIQTLLYCAERGVEACLAGSKNSLFIINSAVKTVKARENSFISVFSLSPFCDGVTLKGMKYPLTDAHITNSFPIGVSNEFKLESAEISVKSGMLLVVLSRRNQ